MEFPWATADGLQLVTGVVIERLSRLGPRLTGNKRPKIFAVDFFRRHSAANEPANRRQQIDCAQQLANGAAGWYLAGPAHDAGNANAAFEGGELSFAQRTGATSVVAVGKKRPVIGTENHE